MIVSIYKHEQLSKLYKNNVFHELSNSVQVVKEHRLVKSCHIFFRNGEKVTVK